MNDMVETTWEEAARCPSCQQPGKDEKIVTTLRRVAGVQNGAQIHQLRCTNCDFGVWLVQVNPDGSVPPKTDHTGHEKRYIGFEGHDQQARDIMRAVRAGIKSETDRSKGEGGYEVRKQRGENI